MTDNFVEELTGSQSSQIPLSNELSVESSIPIAIVGMGCRLPGTASSPDGLWSMLSRGMSGWSRGAGKRFKMNSFYHPATEMNGAFNAKGLYLLRQDVSHFDNHFFNISPVEAKAIDPQQRLLLEVAYEAFENAGITVESLSSSNTGVYCAMSNHDYETMQGRDPELSPMYRFTGTGAALASNRISYFFNLRGPSITLDTACSGSLVAVHEACKAIRCGEIQQALVGGSNLILDPERISVMSSLQFLSSHGRCYAFDQRADGFGRAEGVAAIILKPLDDALQDGDPVQAVIRGTSVNSDGRTPGLTMPSKDAQVRMMRQAYDDAKLDLKQTVYIEAHGTGTQVGDKVELAAIAEVFGPGRSEDSTLYVGSVKTNIGHTESVSGLAGLLKAVLALKKGRLPPNLNFVQANEHICLDELKMKVPLSLLQWPINQVRRASINSFGYGGTNAHVIIDEPQRSLPSASATDTLNGDWVKIGQSGDLFVEKRDESNPPKRHLLVLTHDNDEGVVRMATDLKGYLSKSHCDHSKILENLAYTLSLRRSKLSFRAAVSATSINDLLVSFDSIAKGLIRPQMYLEDPKICFVFTGQGAQWAGMARELLNNYPIFAESIAISELHLLSLGADWALFAELSKSLGESRINEAAISQPCCTAVQLGLVDLLQSWGINPYIVCGHSSGEIAAAYSAGFLSRQDALHIAFHRGRCIANLTIQQPKLKGRMLAAGISAARAHEYISKSTSKLSAKIVVACINSPTSVTISGDESALKQLQHDLEIEGIFNQLLQVDTAYHSHHMEFVRGDYTRSMENIRPLKSNGNIRMISSVTGAEIYGEQMSAEYWARNLVSPVRFLEAIEWCVAPSLEQTKHPQTAANIILEIGPHSALAGPIKQTLNGMGQSLSTVSYHSVLLRNEDSVKSTIEMAGGLFAHGVGVNFDAINDPCRTSEKRVLTDLPTYNWHHTTSHWSESRVSSQYRKRQFARHDLLGVQSHDSLPTEPTWRNYLRKSELPWLNGHIIHDQVIFPASGYICMAMEALRQITLSSGRAWKNILCRFRQVVIERALLIPDDSFEIETFFTLRKYTTGAHDLSKEWKEFRVFSVSENGEVAEHCCGLVFARARDALEDSDGFPETNRGENSTHERLLAVEEECPNQIDPNELYGNLKSIGMNFTAPFTNLSSIKSGQIRSISRITIPETKLSMPGEYQQPHIIHPATLDACFQTGFPVIFSNGVFTSTCVVSSIHSLDISSDIGSEPTASFLSHAAVEPSGRQRQRVEITVTKPSGKEPILISVRGLIFTFAGVKLSLAERVTQYYRIEWSMDVATARKEDIHRVCQVGISDAVMFQKRATYDQFIQVVIQKVKSMITVVDEESMAPHHKKFLQWMRARQPLVKPNINTSPGLREKVKSFGIDGIMLVQVSDHLVDILKGIVDPLSVLMKDNMLHCIYDSDNVRRCTMQLANYVRQLQFKNPHMRILEIGAGTGSTAFSLLQSLTTDTRGLPRKKAKFDKYVLTDISTDFFAKAKENLDQWGDLVEFTQLDIEKPIDEQQCEVGTFDLIVASNVIHAAKSISTALKNIRTLLKPQGKLALLEITNPHANWPVIFGSLPRWWLATSDGSLESPLLKSEEWNEVLSATGFSGVDHVLKDYERRYDHQASLMISTAISQEVPSYLGTISIICNTDEEAISTALSDLIAQTDKRVQVHQSSLGGLDTSNTFCVVLLEVFAPFLASCSQDQFEAIKKLVIETKGVLWVTRGAAVESCDPAKALITGLARTLRSEDHSLDFVTLDLDPASSCHVDIARRIHDVLSQIFASVGSDEYLPEFEYAVREGTILIPRIVEDFAVDDFVESSLCKKEPELATLSQTGKSLSLDISTPGLLETLHWTESIAHQGPPTADEVRIEVKMSGLNFKDLMNAMDQLEGLSAMLIEGSGTVVEVGKNASARFRVGDRVCALGFDGLATISNINHQLVHHIPDGMTLEVAAGIQISYATALYALRDVARLKNGESILIHSGAGALGQAAIAISQYLGAGTIFVTVGNAQKKSLVRDNFGIPEENIFSNRSLSFGPGIRRQTNGQGVHVVLNSLRGEAARESQNCLGQFGRFIELGKKDLLKNTRMEMQYLEKNSLFAVVDLGMVARHKPSDMDELLGTTIDLVHTQKVQLIQPITVGSVSKMEDSLRLMQAGKHVGKLIVNLDLQSQVKIQPQIPSLTKLSEDSTYLVVGGLGGLGRAITRFLATLGAKHIVTLSRSGVGGKETFVKEMRGIGVNLIIHQGSVASVEDIQKLKSLTRNRPICGIVQGAMVLQDSIMPNMTYSQWRALLEPKVTGTWNLHSAFEDRLDFFILLSSVCGIFGSHGQGNYSARGTFQDAFARCRASLNLPVRTIDLGSVISAGYTAENKSAADHAHRQGCSDMRLEELFALINYAITDPIPKDAASSQLLVGTTRPDPTISTSQDDFVPRADPIFSHTWTQVSVHEPSKDGSYKFDVRTTLSTATSPQAAMKAIQIAVVGKLSQLLAMPAEEIRMDQSVSSYGADSLVAIELRNWVSKQLEAQVQNFELMSGQPIHALAKLIAGRSRLVSQTLLMMNN